ncbi:hypothetical protein IAE22_33420, partial [Bacillus sp. S34]|nr:hypothetical protein [Bacillus sp. S34]
ARRSHGSRRRPRSGRAHPRGRAAARGAALLGTTIGLPGNERYQPWRWFMTEYERAKYAPEQHDRLARAQVASLRAAVGAAGPNDARAAELIAEDRRRRIRRRISWT